MSIFGALVGIFVPAGMFLQCNFGTATQSGADIPMATDIVLALGMLSLSSNSVPTSLKVFLAAWAVIDDLGVIIIAFASASLQLVPLSYFGKDFESIYLKLKIKLSKSEY